MHEKLITVGTFGNTMLAAMARNKLEEAGIRSFLNDAESSNVLFGGAITWVKLQVAEEDADRALNLLETPEEDASDLVDAAEPEKLEPEIPEEKPADADQPLEEFLIESGRDRLAERALRATIIGLLVWPVLIYALVLLWQVYLSDEPLRPSRRIMAIIAGMLMGLVFCSYFVARRLLHH